MLYPVKTNGRCQLRLLSTSVDDDAIGRRMVPEWQTMYICIQDKAPCHTVRAAETYLRKQYIPLLD